jgi:transposase
VDLAKHVFQVHGVDRQEQVQVKRALSRRQMLSYFARQAPCLIGMEACASAHYWARALGQLGLTVKLIPPQFVKPYVKSQKNDANDAEAICEAVGRPSMRFVAVKSAAQQDVQALHRIRSELVRQRTAKANQIRGLLSEYGMVVPVGIGMLRRAIPEIQEDAENGLSGLFRRVLGGLRQDLETFDARVAELDAEIAQVALSDETAQRLQSIPGVGPMTATALVAAVGDARQFARGRDLAASLGLTPGQHSSGGKERLLGITKRGDCYLRTLLVHGARAVLKVAGRKDDPRSRWVMSVATRRHKNVAAVALANKMARIAWALLTGGGRYDSRHGMTATA